MPEIKFIDLFAGIGGLRMGFEQAAVEMGYTPKNVMTSEIKKPAIKTLKENFWHGKMVGDIFNVENEDIPDHDVLLGGFPCQSFSFAGKRNGFNDRRGTLFFEVERILRAKRPMLFILENVEGLEQHDGGVTLRVIVSLLKDIGYNVTYEVLDSANFGVAQTRKRVFIVGSLVKTPNMILFPIVKTTLQRFLQTGLELSTSKFSQTLMERYKPHNLYGKMIRDDRGGHNNIHSWDIGARGYLNETYCAFLNSFSQFINDGEMVTAAEIKRKMPFSYVYNKIRILVDMKYLSSKTNDDGVEMFKLNGGALSFEFRQILNPRDVAPTLTATDVPKIAVIDGVGLRQLSIRECLRLFGFPDTFKLNVSKPHAFDLVGNTVVVPVAKAVSLRVLDTLK